MRKFLAILAATLVVAFLMVLFLTCPAPDPVGPREETANKLKEEAADLHRKTQEAQVKDTLQADKVRQAKAKMNEALEKLGEATAPGTSPGSIPLPPGTPEPVRAMVTSMDGVIVNLDARVDTMGNVIELQKGEIKVLNLSVKAFEQALQDEKQATKKAVFWGWVRTLGVAVVGIALVVVLL